MEEIEEKMRKLIGYSQQQSGSHMKNVRLLAKLYKKSDLDQFSHCFLKIVEGLVQEDFQSPYVKRILEFLAKFVAHIIILPGVKNIDPEKDTPTCAFIKTILPRIMKYHSLPGVDCRYNICVFVARTLENIGEEATIDGDILATIQNAMLENLQDVRPLIRLQTVTALARLQNPSNPDCPVIRANLSYLKDPNHLVRREAVKRIAPNKFTIPKVIKRTRDPNPLVRSAVFSHLANIGIKYFRIVQRQFILKSGFSETNPHVKKVFLNYLLPKWLGLVEDRSTLKFLQYIKLDADEADIENTEQLSSQVMQVFFKTEPINKLIEDLSLEESKFIPENQIQSELAHYWNVLVTYLKQDADLEEYVDTIIPELVIFCSYIDRLITNRMSKAMDDSDYLNFQHLLYHLFDMAEHFDLSEEVGRRALDQLTKKVIRNHRLQHRLLNKIMGISSKLASNVDSFANEVCLIISDVWQPLTDQLPDPRQDKERETQIELLKMKLNIMQGDYEDAIDAQDFQKAHQFKMDLKELQRKIDELMVESTPVEQVRVSKEDPETLCWCLDVLAALLVHCNGKMNPSLATCRQEFLMPLVVSKNVEIGWRAFKCLATYCTLDKEFAEEHLHALCFPIASYRMIANFHKSILLDSISAISDFIRLYGTELFSSKDETSASNTAQNNTKKRLYTGDVEEVDPRNDSLTVDLIVGVFLDMLDDEDDDIRDTAATALFKLILNDFEVNPMLITRLILKWYNPMTPKNLQQKLGIVIKAYAEKIPNSKVILVKSIVPILTKIADAPPTSPLAEINIEQVIKFLSVLTQSGDKNGVFHAHTELAKILIEEISSRPVEAVTAYFAKLLNQLQIDPDNSPAFKGLITSTELILEKESLDKISRQQLVKFMAKLTGQAVDSTANTTETGQQTTGITENTTTTPRRLSTVIEDDSEAEDQGNKSNDNATEVRKEAPSKRRRIDSGDGITNGDRTNQASAPAPNNEPIVVNNGERTTTSAHVQETVQVSGEAAAANKSKTSSSESDVIGSSQPESQLELRQTRMRTRLGGAKKRPQKRMAETDDGVRKKRILASESSEQSKSDTSEETNRTARANAKNGANLAANGNRAINAVRILGSESSEQSKSDSSEETNRKTRANAKNGANPAANGNRAINAVRILESESSDTSEGTKSNSSEEPNRKTRANVKNGANLVANRATDQVTERRATRSSSGRSSQSSSSSVRTASSSVESSDSQEVVKKSTRINTKNGAGNLLTNQLAEKNLNNRVKSRPTTDSETNRSKSSESMGQSNSSSSTNSSFREVRRSTRRCVLTRADKNGSRRNSEGKL